MLKDQDYYPEIIRTREKEVLQEGCADVFTIMVDVGGEYAPGVNNYDHHFIGAPVREKGQPYASAGLMAKHFFTEALDALCLQVDLADNGIRQEGWTLSKTIHKCNPVNGAEFDHRFNYLVRLAHREIVEGMIYSEYPEEFAVDRFESDWQVMEWVEEYEAALAASEARVREAFRQEGPMVELTQYEPALMEVAHEAPEGKLYSIFPNPGGEWMVQQIPLEEKSPKGRKALPEVWAGKRTQELDAVTGIQDCVFCHHGRFIGGHKSLDGARQMAALAVTA